MMQPGRAPDSVPRGSSGTIARMTAGARTLPNHLVAAILAACFATAGCERGDARGPSSGPAPVPAAGRARVPARPTVASAVPSATDLLVAMDAADHLVGVASVGEVDERTRDLPRIGDYRDFDWEKLADLRPDVLIVFMAEDRMPDGLKQKAQGLGIQLMNIRVDRLDDVYRELRRLGALVREPAKAEATERRIRERLDAVRRRTAGRPSVRTLIAFDADARGVAGRNTFHDDVLTVAGGQNVATAAGWVNMDPERLRALKPDAVVQLLPDAPEQVLARARAVWAQHPDLPAVAAGRVSTFTEPWVLLPASRLPDLAERFAAALHPDAPPVTNDPAATLQASTASPASPESPAPAAAATTPATARPRP